MQNPVVSIICTVYNKEPWLEKTLTSFIKQKLDSPFEILIVDDASTDGSARIIAKFAEKYPEYVRAFYHETNQGIAKTWVSICQEAKGYYIARCDGDDFWLDSLKLQKQLTLLKQHPEARWSNTDFDIYNENGEFVSASGFESGTIPLADSYEKMLATRGFTMASTWLIERELLLEVNQELDLTTSDDTFNLQLDLFQRTPLVYLPEATVAYVINQGSDSRPQTFSKIQSRFNKLLAIQKDYLYKYPNSDYRKMIELLLERSNNYELALTKQDYQSSPWDGEEITIYFDNGQGFSQENIRYFPLNRSDKVILELPEDCIRIRVDLSELPSFYQQVSLVAITNQTELLPTFTNAIVLDKSYLFPNADPQLIFDTPIVFGREFELTYVMYEVDNLQSDSYIVKMLAQELLDMTIKVSQLESYKEACDLKQKEIEELTCRYNSVVNSRRWTIPTKLINTFRRNK